MPDPQRDYLKLLLSQYWFAPPVALWRAVELRILAEVPFERPILDLGCGDGRISQVLFSQELPLEAGFDPWPEQLRRAAASGMYVGVQQAQGSAMPYPDETFATVYSNSVLEHIPDLMPVLAEAARVLKPGGRFVATVPSDAFRRLLAGYRARVEVGDFNGAVAYADRVDRFLAHYRYPSPHQWAEMLLQVGLHLEIGRYYIPAETASVWDRANVSYSIYPHSCWFYRLLASPRLRWLGYQSWLRRWIVRRLSTRWRRFYELDVPQDGVGSGLLIVATKPEAG